MEKIHKYFLTALLVTVWCAVVTGRATTTTNSVIHSSREEQRSDVTTPPCSSDKLQDDVERCINNFTTEFERIERDTDRATNDTC